MKAKYFSVACFLYLFASSDIFSNHRSLETHRSEPKTIENYEPASDLGCDTPPYDKGHDCNPAWTKYDEARIRKLFRTKFMFCEKQHIQEIKDIINRMEKRLREDGFTRPICD